MRVDDLPGALERAGVLPSDYAVFDAGGRLVGGTRGNGCLIIRPASVGGWEVGIEERGTLDGSERYDDESQACRAFLLHGGNPAKVRALAVEPEPGSRVPRSH